MNKKRMIMLGLTVACLLTGFGFYRMNDGEPFIAAVFTFGILGMMLSVARNMKDEK